MKQSFLISIHIFFLYVYKIEKINKILLFFNLTLNENFIDIKTIFFKNSIYFF